MFHQFWVSRNVSAKRGVITFFRRFSCLTVTENFVEQLFSAAFYKFSRSEKVYGSEGGYQEFPSKNFRLTVPKHFEGNALVFHQFWVSRNVSAKRGGIYVFPSIFLSHSAEKFVGESFSVSSFRVSRKVSAKKEGIYVFPSVFFCLTVTENFVEQLFPAAFHKISGSEKVYGSEGAYQEFPSKNFRPTVPKHFEGNPLVFHQFWVSRNVSAKRGGTYVFPSSFFVSQCQKFS